MATPLVTDVFLLYTTSLNYSPSMAYILFIISGAIAMAAYLYFRKYINMKQKDLGFNDKNYLLYTLLISVFGSIIIIDY